MASNVVVFSDECSKLRAEAFEDASMEYCILPARKLGIVWINDDRYWRWVTKEASWFAEVAYLSEVCWLEISGTMKDLTLRPGVYSLALRVQMERDASGWQGLPINLTLKTSKGYSMQGTKVLDEGMRLSLWPGYDSVSMASQAWVECEVGIFRVDRGDANLDVEFKMFEYEDGGWKGGLFLDAAIIRPVGV